MRKLIADRDHVLVGGHRGCACEYFENTIPAMKEGIRRGADYLEIDLQLTKDGEIVVYHDHGAEQKMPPARVCPRAHPGRNAEGPAGEHAAGGVQLGFGKGHLPGAGIKKRARGYAGAGICAGGAAADLTGEYGMGEQVFAFGADYMVLKHLKQVNPEFHIGLIVPFVPRTGEADGGDGCHGISLLRLQHDAKDR